MITLHCCLHLFIRCCVVSCSCVCIFVPTPRVPGTHPEHEPEPHLGRRHGRTSPAPDDPARRGCGRNGGPCAGSVRAAYLGSPIQFRQFHSPPPH
ncbi:hypothetical protein EDC01DRAFT_643426 [Geopyxis carbonaria]|nr:hypothetical protein EDC01DRAFT_643426 [Geopyxis carbonaria]